MIVTQIQSAAEFLPVYGEWCEGTVAANRRLEG